MIPGSGGIPVYGMAMPGWCPPLFETFFLTMPNGDDKIIQCEFRGFYAHFVRFIGLFIWAGKG